MDDGKQEINQFVSVGTAAKSFGVSTKTIRRWCNDGKICFIWTPTNQRRIDITSKKVGKQKDTNGKPDINFKKDVCYCRVSTAKQKDDLERQINFMADKFPGFSIYKDIGSGLNFKRKSLLLLLEQTEKGLIRSVTISSKDRLCRFAYELLEWIFKRNNVKLVVLDKEDTTPEQELTRDILAIMQVFSCRWNGKRRYKVIEEKRDSENDQVSKVQVKSSTRSKKNIGEMEGNI